MPNQIIVFIPDLSQGNTVLSVCIFVPVMRWICFGKRQFFYALIGDTGGDDYGTDSCE